MSERIHKDHCGCGWNLCEPSLPGARITDNADNVTCLNCLARLWWARAKIAGLAVPFIGLGVVVVLARALMDFLAQRIENLKKGTP